MRRLACNSAIELHGRICELARSSGGLEGSSSDQPPQPTRGSSGRRCSQARCTSDLVPARPPMTMHASPARAIRRLRASPMPHGTTTVAGQSGGGIVSGGTMLRTKPFARIARSAATLVAGLPQPLTRVIPSLARASPASAASSNARDPGSALPSTQTCGLRWGLFIKGSNRGSLRSGSFGCSRAGSWHTTPQFSCRVQSPVTLHFLSRSAATAC